MAVYATRGRVAHPVAEPRRIVFVAAAPELDQHAPTEDALAELLSIAGHELSQPLVVAIGAAELLQRSQSDERRQVIHAMLLRNLRQLQQLIDDLEVMGNPELLSDTDIDPMARRLEPLSLAEMVTSAAQDFASTWPACTIVVACEGKLKAMVDPIRFRQVLSNLLTNAEKFGTPGKPITITGRRHDGDIVISVHNEGPGFPPERADEIFAKSIRLGGAVRGRGWGLYVAKAIVDAHAGHIWAESTPGQGATFFIRLPALPD